DDGAVQDLAASRVRAARQALAVSLPGRGALSAAELRRHGVAADTLRRLRDRGWIRAAQEGRTANAAQADAAQQAPVLTDEQRRALDDIEGRGEGFAAFLLHGATGSGKTEVFLRLIEKTLAAGRQALLLVPEIGLTPQLVQRLAARFGARLTVMHSGLADSARLEA